MHYADGEAQLVYAFDDGPELVERIGFPDPPVLTPDREAAFQSALRLLHLIAGVSYYKAGVQAQIVVDAGRSTRRRRNCSTQCTCTALPSLPTRTSSTCAVRYLPFQDLVIPAKAGIQLFRSRQESWIPAFAGMTGKAEA